MEPLFWGDKTLGSAPEKNVIMLGYSGKSPPVVWPIEPHKHLYAHFGVGGVHPLIDKTRIKEFRDDQASGYDVGSPPMTVLDIYVDVVGHTTHT